MCKISQHLGLCICHQGKIENLDKYWVLYSDKKIDTMIVFFAFAHNTL